MKKTPTLYNLEDITKGLSPVGTEIDGKWLPARPLGYYSFKNRLNLAWLVFTGKADALIWPGGQ
jgi:hypothetical protein